MGNEPGGLRPPATGHEPGFQLLPDADAVSNAAEQDGADVTRSLVVRTDGLMIGAGGSSSAMDGSATDDESNDDGAGLYPRRRTAGSPAAEALLPRSRGRGGVEDGSDAHVRAHATDTASRWFGAVPLPAGSRGGVAIGARHRVDDNKYPVDGDHADRDLELGYTTPSAIKLNGACGERDTH